MAQWLRCCATNRKVASSIPDGVIGIFHWHNSSDYTVALGSTQPLIEMSTRRISGGKCGRCVRLTTLPPSCAVVMKSGKLNFLEPSGPLTACNGTAFYTKMHGQQNIKTRLCSFWRTKVIQSFKKNTSHEASCKELTTVGCTGIVRRAAISLRHTMFQILTTLLNFHFGWRKTVMQFVRRCTLGFSVN